MKHASRRLRSWLISDVGQIPMNPPPDKSVLAKLEGCVVDTITIARYVLHLVCEDGKSISISSPFRFGRAGQIADVTWTQFPVDYTELPKLLGSAIVSATTDAEKALRIEFSTGDMLLASWIATYESYELQIDGERIII